ncbi:MAG: ISNCY family transposase [bacterium]
MEQTLTMSNQEIDRLKVINNVIIGKLSWNEAGAQLDLSGRQVGRLCRKVRKKGNAGTIHGLRGKPSNNQLQPGLLEKAMELVKSKYSDFGPTFANEKLWEIHKLRLSTPTLNCAMTKEGLWKPRKSKAKHRDWRPRRFCVGEMVQLDGSDHDWFEGRGPRCVLLVFIDDATSRILYARFVTVEDTLNLMAAAKTYLLLNGRPIAWYVDKDSIYKINRQTTIEEELRDEQPLTQFTRAMTELGITVIPADSPQAKGRVERGFGTHQDRLVKELRLAGISNMPDGDVFLTEVYVPKHNARFAVVPENNSNAHRPLLKSHCLEEILSLRTERTVANDYTVRKDNKFFQLLADQPVRVKPKDKVLVEMRLDGSRHIRFKDQYLGFKNIAKPPYRPFYAGRKEVVADMGPVKPNMPAKNHPWRKSYLGIRRAPSAPVHCL